MELIAFPWSSRPWSSTNQDGFAEADSCQPLGPHPTAPVPPTTKHSNAVGLAPWVDLDEELEVDDDEDGEIADDDMWIAPLTEEEKVSWIPASTQTPTRTETPTPDLALVL